jgi:hypothetical protein
VVETRRDKNLYLLNVKVCKDTAHTKKSLRVEMLCSLKR